MVPGVTIPLVRLIVGTADVPATVNVDDVTDVTVPTLTDPPKLIAEPLIVIALFANPLFGIAVLIALAGILIVELPARVS